jgi:hypothetical protein
MARDDPATALAVAINGGYRAFGRYSTKMRLEACPCGCVTPDDHARLHSRPLRELTADDIEAYASKAMTTWGDVDDFRHFLPRILELVTGDPGDVICTEIALSKLSYAGWRGWPQRERDAVDAVLWERWNEGLKLSTSAFGADAWLCGVSIAGVDTTRYVDAWRESSMETTFDHLAEFLSFNDRLMTRGTLSNAFYFDDGVTVAAPLRAWLDTAMADDAFQEQLAAAYERVWS